MLSELVIKISTDFKELEKGFQSSQEKLTQFGQKMTNVGSSMTKFVTLPLLAVAGASVKLASDMEETLNKVNVAFGENADSIIAWSKDSINSMGMAQQSALDATALFGDFATGMGLSQGEASKMSMSLTQLGADLSSFKNIPVDQAMTALKGVFTGETESLKGLGVVMTQTNLEAFALSQGIQTNVKDMTEAEKINLRYAYVMNATANAQGDFARTSGGSANQMRIFTETLKQIGVQIGTIILPFFTDLIIKVNSILKAFSNLPDGVKKAIMIFGGIIAVVGPLLLIIGSVITILPILSAGFATLIPVIKGVGIALKFLSANPIGLAITAVIALVSIGIYMVKNWEDIKIKLLKIFNFLLTLFQKIYGWIPFLGDKIDQAKDKISNMIDSAEIEKDANRAKKAIDSTSGSVSNLSDELNVNTGSLIDNEEATKNLEESQKELRKSTIESLDTLGKAITDALKQRNKEQEVIEMESLKRRKEAQEQSYKEQLDAVKNNYKNATNLLKENNKFELAELANNKAIKLQIIDAETLEKIKNVTDQIEAIENQTEQEEKQLNEQQYQNKLISLQKKIDDAKTNEQRIELQQEYDDFVLERQRKMILEERKIQIEALKEKIQVIKNADAELKKIAEDEYNSNVERLDKKLEIELQNEEKIYQQKESQLQQRLEQQNLFMDKQIQNTQDKFDKMNSDEVLQAEATKLALNKNQSELISLLKTYNPKWQDAGQSFGERLVDGLNSTKASIESQISSIMGMLSTVKETSASISDISKDVAKNISAMNNGTLMNAVITPSIAKPVSIPNIFLRPEMLLENLTKNQNITPNKTPSIFLDGRELTRGIAPQMVDMIRARGITS